METILTQFGLQSENPKLAELSLIDGFPPADYYVFSLNVYKCALLWYYSRNTQRDFPVPGASCAHFFDSATACPYVTAVTFDPRTPGLTRDFILSMTDEFLPQNSTAPYYSIQVSVIYDPRTENAVDTEIAAAFQVLKSQPKLWKVEPHLIMDYNIAALGVTPLHRDDVDTIRIPSSGADHYREFETFEKICADAFEYDYMPEITAAHLSMGKTNSLAETPVTYVRILVRRLSDDVIVGVGSYMVARGLEIAYISEIAVHPECQKRGYGQYIINVILSEIKALGLSRAMLASTPSGIALYLKVGFQTVRNCATMMITSKKPKY